jgi:hypothetical protein
LASIAVDSGSLPAIGRATFAAPLKKQMPLAARLTPQGAGTDLAGAAQTVLGGSWGLFPHLEVFGDGKAALRDAIEAGILELLGPVTSPEEFARRLSPSASLIVSDAPLRGDGEAAVSGVR